jgi:NAD-dependent deacetylase
MMGILDDRCGWRGEIPQAVLRGERVPSCPECGGHAKTATVLFGEQLPKHVQLEATSLMHTCDALLIIGTSLNVHPAATYPGLVRSANRSSSAPIVEINAMHASSAAAPDVMITGRAGEWLPILVERLLGESNQQASRALSGTTGCGAHGAGSSQ